MKTDIHPEYYREAKITCSCGNVITAGSTRKSLKTELCSKCHPFFTGQQKLVDTAGRVDKFQARRRRFESFKETDSARKTQQAEKRKAREYKEKEVPAEVLRRAIEETKKREIEIQEAKRLEKQTKARAKKKKSDKK